MQYTSAGLLMLESNPQHTENIRCCQLNWKNYPHRSVSRQKQRLYQNMFQKHKKYKKLFQRKQCRFQGDIQNN